MATATTTLANRFPAFRERNFRLYFYGQLVSFSGTRLQAVAQGYWIFQITHQGWWVGLIAAMSTLPPVALTLFGGLITDRFDVRKVLYVTQVVGIIQAFVLGALALTHVLNRWEMLIFSFLMGVVNAVDAPARQTFISETVEDAKHLRSAISLNTALVHASQFVGPSVGGLLLAVMDPGWTFIINGLTFFPVIQCLAMMRLSRIEKASEGAVMEMVKDGVRYSYAHREIRFLIVLYGVTCCLGYAIISIFPVVADEVFHSAAGALGYLISAAALGAVVGAVIVSGIRKGTSSTFIVTGFLFMGLSIFGFALVDKLIPALALLFFAGAGFTIVSSVLRTMVQSLTEATMRGRVMGVLIAILFLGVTIGNLVIGASVDRLGVTRTLEVNGVLLLGATLFLFIFRRSIPEHRHQ